MSGQYRVILADPPWRFEVWNEDTSSEHGAARYHYPTMNPEQLAALPVRDMAAKNCALFMWTTGPCLFQAIPLMESWGFKYVTIAFTWVKTYRNGRPYCGLGHYTRSATELCLLGKRGQVKRADNNVLQVITAPVKQHSRKPDLEYDRIMRLFDGPYLELFARQQWPGWDVWGNEARKFPAQPFLFGEASA